MVGFVGMGGVLGSVVVGEVVGLGLGRPERGGGGGGMGAVVVVGGPLRRSMMRDILSSSSGQMSGQWVKPK